MTEKVRESERMRVKKSAVLNAINGDSYLFKVNVIDAMSV